MRIVSQVQASKELGIVQPTISRYIKKGKLASYGSGKVDIDELIELRKNVTTKLRVDTPEDRTTDEKKVPKKNKPKENKDTSTDGISYAKARTHKEAFNAKLVENKYKQEMKILIETNEAMRVFSTILDYYNRRLDNLAIVLKNKSDAFDSNHVEMIMEEINYIKETTQKQIEAIEW